MTSVPQYLKLPNEDYIAYHQSKSKLNSFGIIFLGGFMSNMSGTKATALQSYCAKKHYDFIRFDYFGHGLSSRKFTEGTISLWRDNVLTILDQLTDKPQILIGSSMGGWLMLLAALAKPEKIIGLMGIASAPDFTETLIFEQMSTKQHRSLSENDQFLLESEYGEAPYPITKNLIDDGRKHLLLQAPIAITTPVYLIHGKKDQDVPASISQQLYTQLISSDKKLLLVEDGDHRMSGPNELQLISETLEQLISRIT